MTRPTWRFPSRNGGIDYVNESSSAHFSDAPLPKLVRELLQNSLDARQDGLSEPVTVTFTETSVKSGLIGAATLQRHLQSCLDRAKEDNRDDMAEVYANALSVIKKREIPCLAVRDTGTMGLNDARWKALVLQEGGISKGGGAPSGSYGIGKNAVLNVSDLQTVFYSTRIVEGRRGRSDRLQGKATLTGHLDPRGSGEDLQHVGFYAARDGNPVTGNKNIPEFFRLDDVGTGVYIMGFNPQSSDWVDQVASSVIENFFYAIHHQNLTVRVQARERDEVLIDHQTIGYLFDRLRPINRSAVHYYRAIRDLNDEGCRAHQSISQAGKAAGIPSVFGQGAPRRVAHINRNGMLITDSREQKNSPLAPRGRSLWPDFVGVIVPETDSGDLWLRKMENPSHDSLSSGQLRKEEDRREADDRFRQVRRELGEIIERRAEIDRYGEASNIDELAGVLPDMGEGAGDRALTTRVIETHTSQSNSVQISEEVEDEGGGAGDDSEEGSGRGGGSGGNGGGQGEDGDGKVKRRDRRAALRSVRYIPVSPGEAIVAFNPTSDPPREMKLSLMPAGTDRDPRGTRPVAIIEATRIGEDGSAPFGQRRRDRVHARVQ